MSNASSSSSINFALLNQTINRYFPIPLLLFGIIGNILNILIYTRKIFRNNICVNYFLAATSFDSLILMVGLLPRLFSGFGLDPSQTSAVLCKLKFFMVYFTEYTGAWFISLACIERYLSSSTNVHKRELITMKRAYLSMVFVILMGFVIFGEVFYCIDINQQLLGAPNSCYQLKQNIACQIVDSLMQLVFQTLTPTLMMIVFGFLVLRNIRQKRRRIDPIQATNSFIPAVELQMTTHRSTQQQQPTNIRIVSTEVNRTAQKRDAQLIQMLLVQVSVFVISTLPISVYKLYSIATIYDTKSILRKSIENTAFNLSVICLYLNNSVKFYIYTLCGAVFRKELMKLFRLA